LDSWDFYFTKTHILLVRYFPRYKIYRLKTAEITGCAVAPAVLTATDLVNGRRRFSTPYRIDTP